MQQTISLYFFVCLATIAFARLIRNDVPGERELRLDLLLEYDPSIRPVKRYASAVPVKISLSPLRIRDFSEKDQLISLESWLLLYWQDDFLTWDPRDYDGITAIHVSPSKIWVPDIAVYTASPDTSYFPVVQTKAIIFSNGSVLWVPPFTINSRCPLPFSAYQNPSKTLVTCNIRFGSWTYSGDMIDLQLHTNEVDLSSFEDSNYQWKLAKVVSDRQVKYYDCCPEPYPAVDFNITLKRRNYFFNNEINENGFPLKLEKEQDQEDSD